MEEKKLIGNGKCPFCGKDNKVEVTGMEMTGFEKWRDGEGNIQDVMPFLSAEKREILMTGICLTCQKRVFDSSNCEPEAIEYELDKIGYRLGREVNESVEFFNAEEGTVILLDYILMRATKVLKENEFLPDNGNFEEFTGKEERILRSHGFGVSEDDEYYLDDDGKLPSYLDDDLPF